MSVVAVMVKVIGVLGGKRWWRSLVLLFSHNWKSSMRRSFLVLGLTSEQIGLGAGTEVCTLW